jgi:hypothetical protein
MGVDFQFVLTGRNKKRVVLKNDRQEEADELITVILPIIDPKN